MTRRATTHRGLAVWLCAACLFLGAAWATTYRAMTLDALVEAAELAFYAEVRDVAVFEREGRPWTRVVFEVERDLLAEAAAEDDADRNGGSGAGDRASVVELSFLGGSPADGPSLAVALMPTFAVGERVLVFAYLTEAASPVVGFRQGLWRTDGDALRDEEGRVLGIQEGAIVAGAPAAPVEALLDAFVTRFRELR